MAFDPMENTTIKKMLLEAESAIDATFPGYKGGEYTMSGDSPVWIAGYGKCGEEITVSMVMDWVEGKSPPVPSLQIIENPSLSGLKNLLKEYAEFIESPEYYPDSDWKQYIYESVINTFFEKRVWEIINGKS